MKIVIQCAATKQQPLLDSGFRAEDKRLVKFVANPALAPVSESYVYVRPDDLFDKKSTWRERLIDYNNLPTNMLKLFPAYQLYKNKTYVDLIKKFGSENIYILSAGWGLISATFFTPDYDITFSAAKNVKPYCRRKKIDLYSDICLLPDDGDSIVFLGGQDYLPLFCNLTAKLKGVKKVFFNSEIKPHLGQGFISERYVTKQKTNWHYSCAQDLIDGKIRA